MSEKMTEKLQSRIEDLEADLAESEKQVTELLAKNKIIENENRIYETKAASLKLAFRKLEYNFDKLEKELRE
ncbi:MAG: hypothetical protein RBG13Loki_2112 [Promethearchaeota archaeon CR_4]|nr:MAG: hypothetical protein RBG13Loki_2112 [Candidatus Lokiarchaeota archaeon CR_4]